MADKKVPTCSDCIHADVCEQNPLYTEFSRDNPAYCEGFKDKSKLVAVVRCKDCQQFEPTCPGYGYCYHWDYEEGMSPNEVEDDDFCSYGERRTDNERKAD